MLANGEVHKSHTSATDTAPPRQSSWPTSSPKPTEEQLSRQRSLLFKVSHILQIIFFLWLLVIHGIGIYFFTRGFLLTRLVLDDKSECTVPPIQRPSWSTAGNSDVGCWHPKTFKKAVIIIIDALRYDFTVPYYSVDGEDDLLFHNSIPVFHETSVKDPTHAVLLPFIADPPTTTLQRLKGLTTGTLPTFMDAGSNFAGTTIEEDNLIAQLQTAGKNIVHLGDDTWHALFPGQFDPNLTRPYDSFNVWDLHTLDNGVIEHIFPLLQPANTSKWDMLIGHFLGVDHAGHRYGPNHLAMREKLSQMDNVIRRVKDLIDDDTLLVIMGDHGMDAKGDHGGESDDEVEATLWMYSKAPVFGRTKSEFAHPPATAKERPVGQIDLVPTLALLLGLPIPYNNLGSPIQEAFVGNAGNDWRNLATVNRLTAAQIKRYQQGYALAKGEDVNVIPEELWTQAGSKWDLLAKSLSSSSPFYEDAYRAYHLYQSETLRIYRSLWASFDQTLMAFGIEIIAGASLLLLLYSRHLKGDISLNSPTFLRRIFAGTAICIPAGRLFSLFLPEVPGLSLFGAGVGGGVASLSVLFLNRQKIAFLYPTTLWSWLTLIFTLSQSIGFAANSFTIWEDEILLFFLATFGVCATLFSLRQPSPKDKAFGLYHSIIFLVLTRLASFSRLCREEQMPYCRSTYYASSTSSTSAPWQLLLPYITALLLPIIVKSFYTMSRSYEGSAVFWIRYGFRGCLWLIAVYWTLAAADDGKWLPSLSENTLKNIRTLVAQIVFAISFAVGLPTFLFSKPCIKIGIHEPSSSPSSPPQQPPPSTTKITILGTTNPYATHYLLLPLSLFPPLLLLSSPMGNLSLSLLLYSLLTLPPLLHTHLHLPRSSSIGPTILALLASFHFFKTGHTATLASIQWNAAFIPLHTIIYPFSPLLILMNTFAPHILCALFLPTLALWNHPVTPGARSRGILAAVSRDIATHFLYFAVQGLATTVWAWWLRRHLMVYRVFGPRFMMGAIALCVVEVVGVLGGLVGVRRSVASVGEVFGS
ncbi:MAG: hypothetical protein Q9160_000388 [Pyrenula sp. 1 TL-2023]